jgi:ADP-dependent NAD(P)H-hydrate dehydratase / NAD(P)H-hydrate epimerase
MSSIVEWMNAQDGTRIAIDVPTGVNADTGDVAGAALKADLTLTMGAPKIGLVLGDGRRHAGIVETIEIGIPRYVLHNAGTEDGSALLTTDEGVSALLPLRSPGDHKYSVGVTAGLLGSRNYPGAAAMAATAAARVGAGSVLCGTPKGIQQLLQRKLTEVMVVGLEDTPEGTLANDSGPALNNMLNRATSLLIGCGLGSQPDTAEFVRSFLRKVKVPVVIDADGIGALEGYTELCEEYSHGQWILTPHAGEFSRLTGHSPRSDCERMNLATRYAREWNVILILKGLPGIVGLPDVTAVISSTGNPAVATAGSGYVLAGLVAGLAAQGLEPDAAAIAALHIAGACADAYIETRSARSYMATDLLNELPYVLHRLRV